MSDSPVITQSFSFAARDVILNMTLMESLGFGKYGNCYPSLLLVDKFRINSGIYTSVFWFTLYILGTQSE